MGPDTGLDGSIVVHRPFSARRKACYICGFRVSGPGGESCSESSKAFISLTKAQL